MKEKILVVDDNLMNLEAVSHHLKKEGYQIALASDGKQAMEILKQDDFDLVLLDVLMPDMDGFEACAMIRKIDRLKDVPILFLTAKTEREDIVAGLELGAQDYIPKPFDAAELIARVKTHLELKQSKHQLKVLNENLERKVSERTQELTLANEKLQQLDDAKIEFLRIISHEINTPLTGIKGFSELIKKEVHSDELETYFQYLDLSINRLKDFTDMALEITRLKLQKYQIKSAKINVVNLIEYGINFWKSMIQDKGLVIHKRALEQSAAIWGDQKLMGKVLVIIMENAIKHSTNNTEIVIEYVVENDASALKVRDSGSGFREELTDGNFKLFSTGSEHVDLNTGLSLAMVNLAMIAQNGKLQLENTENGGVTILKFANGSAIHQKNKG